MIAIALIVALVTQGDTVRASAKATEHKPVTRAQTKQEPDSAKRVSTTVPPVIHVIDSVTEHQKAEKYHADSLHEAAEEIIAKGTAWLAFFTFLLVAATITLAVFTYRLWRATLKVSEETTHASVAQAKRLRASIKQAARSATAMENVAIAMGESASIAKRQHVEEHPADLVLDRASIEPGTDGPPIITFQISNRGGSFAHIKSSYVSDWVFRSSEFGSNKGPAAIDHPDLVEYVFNKYQLREVRHVCSNVRNEDIPPAPKFAAMIPMAIGPLFAKKPSAPPEISFNLTITLSYLDEVGVYNSTTLSANCDPPARGFEVSEQMKLGPKES